MLRNDSEHFIKVDTGDSFYMRIENFDRCRMASGIAQKCNFKAIGIELRQPNKDPAQ